MSSLVGLWGSSITYTPVDDLRVKLPQPNVQCQASEWLNNASPGACQGGWRSLCKVLCYSSMIIAGGLLNIVIAGAGTPELCSR
eukprot:2387597-Amphidinium_carterae.1